MKKLLLIIIFLLIPCVALGAMPVNPSYVSPTGSGSTCTLVAPCALSYANTNADAGDTVYLIEGTYSLVGESSYGIRPSNSGSAGNTITFQNYNSGTVIIEGDGNTRSQYGVSIDDGIDYITVTGIKFKDIGLSVTINGSYNIFSYNEVYHTSEWTNSGASPGAVMIYNLIEGHQSVHNWIHHNTIHTIGFEACGEGTDGISIGDASAAYDDNYNTIENNTIYSMGHTLTDDYGMYNVWRNNVGYNQGWKSASNVVYGTATGGSASTLVDSGKDFDALGVQAGWYVFSESEMTKLGEVTAALNTTVTFTEVGGAYGSPTYSNGVKYAVGPCAHAPSKSGDYPGNGMYGHRGFANTGYEDDVNYRYNLWEGNRIGYASQNPANNGADGFTLGSPGNILRYNSIFGADGPGINLKRYAANTGKSGANNRIYNNTVFSNGRVTIGNNDVVRQVAIYEYGPTSINNVFKNNILYDNVAVLDGTAENQIWSTNLCDETDATVGCIAGNPTFVSSTLDDYNNVDTVPNLNLQSGSPAINAGTHLTTVAAADTGSGTSLVLTDALYFQDGTWGSSLSNVYADWICVGATLAAAECFQVGAINYSTNTITVADFTREDGDKVWLYKNSSGTQILLGTAPDIGAYEYGSGIIAPTALGVSLSGASLQ